MGLVDEKLEAIVNGIHAPVGEVNMKSSPLELGFDSIDMVELQMAIEDEFDVELTDEQFERFCGKPLNELARFIEGELGL